MLPPFDPAALRSSYDCTISPPWLTQKKAGRGPVFSRMKN